jgi:hypothetical protein
VPAKLNTTERPADAANEPPHNAKFWFRLQSPHQDRLAKWLRRLETQLQEDRPAGLHMELIDAKDVQRLRMV